MANGQYTKTTWANGVTPVDQGNMNHLETQHEEAAYLVNGRMTPPIVRWVTPGWAYTLHATTVITANRIYYLPIYVPESVAYDRIGIYVFAGDGVGGLADLRIFEWNAGVPGDLILNAGTVSTNASGAKEIVIAQSLGPGLYFLALRGDQTPTLNGISEDRGFLCPVTSMATTNAAGLVNTILYDDAVYADPAGAVDGALNCLYVFIRLREA